MKTEAKYLFCFFFAKTENKTEEINVFLVSRTTFPLLHGDKIKNFQHVFENFIMKVWAFVSAS